MIQHTEINDQALKKLIKQKAIMFGGNSKLAIYGTLQCRSGQRMKKENRVFFSSEKEALQQGFCPCGHCLPAQYKKWKNEPV